MESAPVRFPISGISFGDSHNPVGWKQSNSGLGFERRCPQFIKDFTAMGSDEHCDLTQVLILQIESNAYFASMIDVVFD